MPKHGNVLVGLVTMGILLLISESTKIRIPIQSLREAANLVTDMDSQMLDEGRFMSSDQKIEEKVKKEKLINEKSGWIDCTEVLMFKTVSIYYSSAYKVVGLAFGH